MIYNVKNHCVYQYNYLAIMPFLKQITSVFQSGKLNVYPFNIPAFSHGIHLDLTTNVTFLVGENGSGKSTLLEAISDHCGFNASGGNRNHHYDSHDSKSILTASLKFSWFPKVTDGFFLRAESFFNFASYIDQIAEDDSGIYYAYGGKSLHQQSHGESFLSLFNNRFKKGIYLLDEPEAALSPKRQLSLLVLIHDLETSGKAQFIIATHSPILLSYPGAVLFSLDGAHIETVDFRETEHYQITKDFLEHPDFYYKHLFSGENNIE